MMWLWLGLLALGLLYRAYRHNPDEVMDDDLRAIDAVFGTEFEPIQDHDVSTYYTSTTQRDYRLLEWFIGPGMHTRLTLPAPALLNAGNTVQMLFVLMEISRTRAAHVLEVGFGMVSARFFWPHCCQTSVSMASTSPSGTWIWPDLEAFKSNLCQIL